MQRVVMLSVAIKGGGVGGWGGDGLELEWGGAGLSKLTPD